MQKYSASIIIAAFGISILIVFGYGYIRAIDAFSLPYFLKPVIIIIYVSVAIAFIVVTIKRVREIKENRKSDLSKY